MGAVCRATFAMCPLLNTDLFQNGFDLHLHLLLSPVEQLQVPRGRQC